MSASFADYQGIIGAIGGIIAIGVAVATYFRGVIQQNQKIHTLELELNTIKTQFNVFWTVVEKELPKILIKPHREDIDALLRKMQSKEGLTLGEKIIMKDKMKEALNEGIGDVDSGLALGYALLIGRIESEIALAGENEEKLRREQLRRDRGGVVK